MSADLPEPTDADRVETEIRYRLPDLYWEVARTHQGCIPDPSVVMIGGHRVDVGLFRYAIDRDAFPTRHGRGYGVLTAWGTLDEHWPRGLVPFTDDTGGNQLAFDYRAGDQPRIVWINHEVAGDARVRPIAPSFAVLMEALGGVSR